MFSKYLSSRIRDGSAKRISSLIFAITGAVAVFFGATKVNNGRPAFFAKLCEFREKRGMSGKTVAQHKTRCYFIFTKEINKFPVSIR